jgi:ABC-type uncharacterized transport system fused permease/ATPase subunit
VKSTRINPWVEPSQIALSVAVAVAVNGWNKLFFDALQYKNEQRIILSIGLVIVLAVLSALTVALLQQVHHRQLLLITRPVDLTGTTYLVAFTQISLQRVRMQVQHLMQLQLSLQRTLQTTTQQTKK